MNIWLLDFETTGLNVFQDDIIELAIKKFDSDITYHTFVRPKIQPKGLVKYVPPNITKLTGINDKHIEENGISKYTAIYNFHDYITSHSEKGKPIYIVSHNGNSFDFLILKKLIHDYNINHLDKYDSKVSVKKVNNDFDRIRFIDTVLLAKLIYHNDKVNQNALCKKFNIVNDTQHRALDDIIALEKIFTNLCSIIDTMNDKEENYFLNHPQELCNMTFI